MVIHDQWNHLDGLIKISFKAISGLSAKVPQKIAACELIAALGENLKEAAELVVPTYQVRSRILFQPVIGRHYQDAGHARLGEAD